MNFLPPGSLTAILVPVLLATAFSSVAVAQEPKSAAPAKELAQLLTSKKLDSIAARMPDNREEFVGALSFPGSAGAHPLMTFSNDLGLKVEFNDYTWSGKGPHVFFRPFVDARNTGRLIIKGPETAAREAGAQEVQKKRELKL